MVLFILGISGTPEIDTAGYIAKFVYWGAYGAALVVLLLIFAIAYYLTSFPYKLHYFPVTGGVTSRQADGTMAYAGRFSIDRPKTNRLKWSAKHDSWQSLWPLFNRHKLEPWPPEYIYPGKTVYGFRIENSYYPAKVDVNEREHPLMSIKPIPYHIRNWQIMELKQNEQEFRKHSFWEDNKYFIMVILTAAICCALVALTVWWTYRAMAGGVEQANMVARAIEGLQGYAAP